jgi:polyribonucleotide nucleotidyltransferase
MDIKISSVSTEILQKALEQAKRGRLHILSIMQKTIAQPENEISPLAPQVINARIDPDKIGLVIGPAGKNIKALSEKYDVQINIDEDGALTVYGKDQKSVFEARDEILGMVEEPEVGKIYNGTVKRIMDFGAFVEILPGREGLCHISRLSKNHVEKVSDVVKEGDSILVKLTEIDHLGRLNLAAVDALDENGELPRQERPPRGDARPFDRSRDSRSSHRDSHRDR